MKYIVLRADDPDSDWTGASVVDAKSEKAAATAAAGEHPGHYGVQKLAKDADLAIFDVKRSVTVS